MVMILLSVVLLVAVACVVFALMPQKDVRKTKIKVGHYELPKPYPHAKPIKPQPNRSVKYTSIFDMTDEQLKQKFGCNWVIAREEIERKRRLVESGLETDWDAVREGYDRDEPPTPSQDAVLCSRGITNVKTKYHASFVIDEIFLGDTVKRIAENLRLAEEWQKKKDAQLQEKLEKLKKKEDEKRQKEVVALKLLAQEMQDPNYKPRRLTAKRSKDLLEFQTLVNNVLEDNIISIEEIEQIRNWLNAHKILAGDFEKMFTVMNKALEDGKIDEDETAALYESMLDCIITLRRRH